MAPMLKKILTHIPNQRDKLRLQKWQLHGHEKTTIIDKGTLKLKQL